MKERRFGFATTVSGILAVLFLVSFPAAAQQKTHTNSIGMQFVLIPAGSFMMGAHEFEGGLDWEKPRHKVTVSKPFYIGKYEVTQEQWHAVMGSNPSKFATRDRPVENVSWDDAQEFIRRLNAKEGGSKYRLPTEAEWEYAARAGSDTAYCYGDDPDAESLHQYAWYNKNSGGKTQIVGKLKPNAWGLYDMHGNVWEWVQDWYDSEYYTKTPEKDPLNNAGGSDRVLRGGGWRNVAGHCRSASRNSRSPDYRYEYRGFRLARSPQ